MAKLRLLTTTVAVLLRAERAREKHLIYGKTSHHAEHKHKLMQSISLFLCSVEYQTNRNPFKSRKSEGKVPHIWKSTPSCRHKYKLTGGTPKLQG